MTGSTAAETNFRDWIGRSMTETDVVTAYPANCFSATLDRQDPPFGQGDPLPPAWHYFYFNEVVPLAPDRSRRSSEKGRLHATGAVAEANVGGIQDAIRSSGPNRRGGSQGHDNR